MTDATAPRPTEAGAAIEFGNGAGALRAAETTESAITGKAASDAGAALDPVTFPLRGTRLIEASAGTGKTWTIALLYLRLVLGHGGGPAHPARPLSPREIAVVTFTKAAAQELRDRIRARLVEAAAVFRGERAPPDDALARLLADYPLSLIHI